MYEEVKINGIEKVSKTEFYAELEERVKSNEITLEQMEHILMEKYVEKR